MIFLLFLYIVQAQWLSESYGIIDPPFTSIDSMGLINHFLYCVGNVKPNDVSIAAPGGGRNQVWATRTDLVVPWSWSYSDANETVYKQITVKHSKLGIPQSLMFLLSDSGIMVLPFWGLSPRETPDLNHTSWLIPVRSISMITGLSASGGVYGLRGSKVHWIPVIEPFSLTRPRDSTTLSNVSNASSFTTDSSLSSFNMTSTSNFSTGNLFNETMGNMTNSTAAPFVESTIYQIIELNSTRLIWLGLDYTTLYTISISNGSQVLNRVSMNGQSLISEVMPLIQVDGNVIAFIVHPRTFDYYLAIDNVVKVYSGNDGALKGTIMPTFPTITSLEINNDGELLLIGGTDTQPKGRLDIFDLKSAQLTTVSGSVRHLYSFAILLTIYLLID